MPLWVGEEIQAVPRPPELIRLTVVAGVLRDAQGRVLFAQRPPGKVMAGKWELPGGKVAAGESLHDALVRELAEELGVTAAATQPLLQLRHRYPDRDIDLHAREVTAWTGSVRACEGQTLRWVAPAQLTGTLDLLAADGPIVTALRLPPRYLISPPDVTPQCVPGLVARARRAGVDLLQLRRPDAGAEALAHLAAAAARATADGAAPAWLLGGDPAVTLGLARRWGAAGLHLPARHLAQLGAARRTLGEDAWLIASCHDRAELEAASTGGADAAVLGPVRATPTHPDRAGLGWARFAELIRDLPLPVYALGGVADGDVADAREHGAQGVAGIRGVACG